MAFNFGAQPAPASAGAPASGGITGLGSAGASATGGAFSFGGFAAPAPGPSTFSFTGAPTSAPGQSSFSFGGGNPSSNPAAPSFGGSIANNLFGAAAPTPAASSSTFGATPQASAAGQQPVISGNMPYSALPQQYKADIDTLYNLIRNHQRTMELVKSMAPHQLAKSDDQTEPILTADRERLRGELHDLSQQVSQTSSQVQVLQSKAESLGKQVFLHAKCPLEAVALRRGVRLEEEKKDEASFSALNSKVQQLLDSQFALVDRLERMPTPYLFESLTEWQQCAQALEAEVQHQLNLLATVRDDEVAPLESLVRVQHEVLVQNAMRLSVTMREMDEIRNLYRIYERGENVIDKADQEDFAQEQRWNDQVILKFVEQQAQLSHQQPQQPSTSTPSAGFSLGSSSAPAPFSFSSTSTAPPSLTTGFAFSPSPGPSATAFGIGGASTTSAAPATSLFPSTAPTFGNAPAAASSSVPGAFSYSNSSSSSSRSKKSNSRATGRVRA